MAVDYRVVDQTLGAPPINVTGDTTQRINLGQIVVGQDASTAQYGQADFMYVKFTGTVARGDMVLVNRQAKTAVVAPAAATKGFFGTAMAAQVTGQYGYVMLRGIDDAASVLTGAAVQVAPNYGSAVTAGRITDAVTANYIIDGVAIRVTGASNVGCLELNYPYCSGR